MELIINGKTVVLPSSLSEISLGERIRFQDEVGSKLDEMLQSVSEIEDELEKEIELVQFGIEKMAYTFAFFAGVTVDAVKESEYMDDIAEIYFIQLAGIFDQEQEEPKEL